ncbi:MAG TPA: vWA domain-containing protein [Gemmatimonadales bacterium]|nr:vWA domain-containing protein [Gemmatimonadales bacterium]
MKSHVTHSRSTTMTRHSLTDITVLLDRSGSMQSIADDVVGGFSQFVESQRTGAGQAVLSLVQFDSQSIDTLFSARPVHEVKLPIQFEPRGSTPLLDALGQTIVSTGARLKATRESDRPGRVIFVAITDGLENASHEYNLMRVREMIQHQESVYKWDFVYLGANVDAFAESEAMGFATGKAGSFRPGMMRQAYAASAGMINQMRELAALDLDAPLALSDEAREQMDPGSAEEFKKRGKKA